MSEILRLQTNEPERIALEFTDGLSVASKFGGDQLMFSLCDGRKMFLPPHVARKIAESGIRPQEEFMLCKREVTNGNRRTIQYQIDLAPAANGRTAEAAVTTQPTRQVYRMPAPEPEPELVVEPARPRSVAAPNPTASAQMIAAGKWAVDAALEVESHARSRGMVDFVFGAENIQKMMVALYIDLRKGGRA